ncbi:hypothetical protein PENARI_c040G06723 [Penicillium arizonense]|uniref:Uncharacterized protein n=1 Tax=Penicillium arizonense TaxID=1835702 RepID=A0A1F5L3J4_PENAI|nr:hypothetical protein PENARI_c040G06723 [Penicillium arizonense]OGE47606.1 hypothetical protein PENARI_c040G06723 [Penicillium arizonense]
MSRLTSVVTGTEANTLGPQTPAQSFYQQYAIANAAEDLNTAKSPRSTPTMRFSTTKMCGKLSHNFVKVREIQNDDGSVDLVSQITRHIWPPGNESDKPSVSVPLSMVCNIGPNNAPGTVGGLQFNEVWLYWDTYLLQPYLPADSVVFSSKNLFDQD